MACGSKPWLTVVHSDMVRSHPGIMNDRHLTLTNPGVYFAKEGTTSLGSYAHGGSTWRNSQLYPQSCAALAEIVNLPENFVSNHPHYVVADTTWIVWYVSWDITAQLVGLHVEQPLPVGEQPEQPIATRPQKSNGGNKGCPKRNYPDGAYGPPTSCDPRRAGDIHTSARVQA
jgi:hypothetical protein